MLKKENTSLFALLGLMGAMIIVISYGVMGSIEMLSKPSAVTFMALPIFMSSIFAGMSLAAAAKKYELKQEIDVVDIGVDANYSEHYISAHIDAEDIK